MGAKLRMDLPAAGVPPLGTSFSLAVHLLPATGECGVWSPILPQPLTCVYASVAQAAQWVQKTGLSHVIGEKKQVSEAGMGKDKQNSKAGCKRYYSKARSHKGSNSQ